MKQVKYHEPLLKHETLVEQCETQNTRLSMRRYWHLMRQYQLSARQHRQPPASTEFLAIAGNETRFKHKIDSCYQDVLRYLVAIVSL